MCQTCGVGAAVLAVQVEKQESMNDADVERLLADDPEAIEHYRRTGKLSSKIELVLANKRMLAKRIEIDREQSNGVGRIQPMVSPPVSARMYMCVGKCRSMMDLPGVCQACYEAERQRDHWATMAASLESIPEHYRWARVGCPLLSERIPDLRDSSARDDGAESVGWTWDSLLAERIIILHGETGAGKTSFACALLRYLVDAATPDSDERVLGRARRARFVGARDIPLARVPDGPPAVEQARRAGFLVLDDVLQEAGVGDAYGAQERCRQVADLLEFVDAHDKQIVVTTYGTPATWAAKYGAGIARRYWESADSKIIQLGRGSQ